MKKYFELITAGTDVKIVSLSKCKYCGEEFPLFDAEKRILDKKLFKYPEHCPLCNFKLLNSFLNDKNLYRRKDSKTGKGIISIFSEHFKGEVIEAKDYKQFILDDGALKYGKDIKDDIFGSFLDIYNKFPKPSRLVYPELENSEYSSHVGWAKNVYMSYCVFVDCENIYSSFRINGGCKNIFSSFDILGSSNIYESTIIGNSYNIYFGENIIDCSNLLYCKDMNNSKECIFSCNQVNQEYKIFNKQYKEEEYKKIKKDIYKMLNNKKEFKFLMQKYNNFLKNNLIKESINTNRCEKVVGESIFDSTNSINVFSSSGLNNCSNDMFLNNIGDDGMVNIINSVEAGGNCENCIGSCSFGTNLYNIFFSFGVVLESKNIYYSYDIETCEEIMFSIGLKNKKYCILNKVYKKEEYFKLKENIIQKLKKQDKWGDSLPVFALNFPYNDTLAYDYFKINKVINFKGEEKIIDGNSNGIVTLKTSDSISDAILDLGGKEKINIKYRTKEKNINIPDNYDKISAKDLPNINSDEIDNIINKIIICEESGKPYKIINAELNFLKENNLPLPTICNDLRLEKLISIRPTGQLNVGKCDKCQIDMLTVYKEKPKYRVYCSKCYKTYMYS